MRECTGTLTISFHPCAHRKRPDGLPPIPGKRQARPFNCLPASPSGAARKRWTRRLALTGVSVAALTALSAGSAPAQTWTGGTSNDWTNGANWSTGAAPTGGAVIIDNGSPSNVVLGVASGATAITGNIRVGSGTAGVATSLTIQNGATLTSGGASTQIGFGGGGPATVTVTGPGSQWTNNGVLVIGNGSTAILNIESGGTVVVPSRLAVGGPTGTATLNVNGGTLAANFITMGNASAQANYDNAVVRALAGSANFFGGTTTKNNVAAGGLTIDTNCFNVGTIGFSGVGGLTVAGTGIFGLRGTQAYTGQTVIQSGSTLALQSAGSIAASSRLVANGTFDISASLRPDSEIQSLGGSGTVTMGTNSLTLTNAHDTFAGTFIGGSGLTLAGGSETLTGNNAAFAGPTTVQGGMLSVNGNLGGTLSVLSAGRLEGIGTVGTTTNAGVVAPGNSIGTLTIAGNYTGNGGALEIESALGGDASPTDRLVVTGNTAGTTTVRVLNRGGLGAQTNDGIRIIDVGGASNGNFTLAGDYVLQGRPVVVGGAYGYGLYQNGVSTPNDGDWYLRSTLLNAASGSAAPSMPLYQPGVPLYENYAQVLLGLNDLPTLQQRVGDRYWGGADVTARSGGGSTQSPFWARIEGQHSNMQPSNTTGSTYSSDQLKVQTGVDGLVLENGAGRLIVGLNAQYGTVAADVSSIYGNGRIRADGYGVGATLTWYGDNGFYVDGQAQTTKYISDLSSTLTGTMTSDNNGVGYAFSVESGKRIEIGNGWSVTPQAQLTYSAVSFSDFADRFGALVSLDNADSLLGRAGVAVNHLQTWRDGDGQVTSADVYGIANVHYEFLNGTSVIVSGTNFASANDRLWGSIGGGGTYSWSGGKYSLYGEVSYNTSLSKVGDSDSYKGIGGFRILW
jgi:fibronectin-binding autotransporter adhesin